MKTSFIIRIILGIFLAFGTTFITQAQWTTMGGGPNVSTSGNALLGASSFIGGYTCVEAIEPQKTQAGLLKF